MIKTIEKTPEKMVFEVDMGTSLANAIRRSVNEIPIFAIEEVDIYKNDSALYDQIIAHRIGLIPLNNQKISGKKIQLKLKAKGGEVLAGELGKEIAFPQMPIVFLEKNQELELVARGKEGTSLEHAKFSPGLFYYRYIPKIEISPEGEKQSELAELYPKVFEFVDGKLKVKNEWACTLDSEDVRDFKGISIKATKGLVMFIESWGQIDAEEIFIRAIKALKDNLNELSKALK